MASGDREVSNVEAQSFELTDRRRRMVSDAAIGWCDIQDRAHAAP
jgi:hypothetical protein